MNDPNHKKPLVDPSGRPLQKERQLRFRTPVTKFLASAAGIALFVFLLQLGIDAWKEKRESRRQQAQLQVELTNADDRMARLLQEIAALQGFELQDRTLLEEVALHISGGSDLDLAEAKLESLISKYRSSWGNPVLKSGAIVGMHWLSLVG